MRFGSTTKVLSRCMLMYCRILLCERQGVQSLLDAL